MRLKKFLQEGTWAQPNTKEKALKFQKIMGKPLTSSQAQKSLSSVLGDDELYDAMDDDTDVRSFIAEWINDNWLKKKVNWAVEWDKEAIDIMKKVVKKYM